MKSSVPLLAPEKELMRIAGINQAIQSICNIGGPALGAILLLAFDMSLVMLLDVLGAIIACTTIGITKNVTRTSVTITQLTPLLRIITLNPSRIS